MSESAARGRAEAARLRAARPALEARSALLSAIRGLFLARGFLEVETPVRIPTPALELHIDAEPAGQAYLRTSPELHMKRLLAAGYERIFQIGPCFRRGERGALHQPEYSMLEWYRAGADYLEVLRDCADLVAAGAGAVGAAARGGGMDWSADWLVLSVEESFVRWAGWNPVEAFDPDRFDLDMATKVEPALPKDRPCLLIDYPIGAGALARRGRSDPRTAERWELYLGGIEIANAFSELTDAHEQRRRFEEWGAGRAAGGREVYALDEAFLAALESGLPECAGVALGVDRLLLALLGAPSLDEVIPFGRVDEA